MARFSGLFLIAALALAGCSNSGETSGQEPSGELEATTSSPPIASSTAAKSAGETQLAEADTKSEEAPKPIEIRPNPAGRWIVVISDNREAAEYPAMLLDITKVGDKYDAKLLEAQFLPGKPELKSAEINDKTLHFVFEASAGHFLDIEAAFDKGGIRGNVAYGPFSCDPIRMVPTEVDTIKDLKPKETAGKSEFEGVAKVPVPEPGPDGKIVVEPASDPVVLLRAFCKAFPRSALTLPAYGRIVVLAKRMKLDSAAVDQAVSDFVQAGANWGPRMANKAKLESGIILNATKYFVGKSITYFDQLEKEMSKETLARWKKIIDDERASAMTNVAVETLQSNASADEQNKAAEQLETVRKKEPFNHEILYALAKYNEDQKRDDKAFEYYSRLAVLPFTETILQETWEREQAKNPLPSESAARLWKKRKGNTDGLDAYLDKQYRKELASFGDKPVPPRENGSNRVALMELFTGVECIPCIGPNVVVERLENMFAPTEVICLLYELHAAGPNPLANEEAEARHAFYFPDPTKRGYPTIMVSGKQVENVGSPLVAQNQEVFAKVRAAIDPILAEKTDIKIKLQAVADKGTIQIRAQADGLKSSSQSIRLRLAIAEDEVTYIGSNGIRHHHMVVRTMPGGPNGIGPDEGKISYKKVIRLSDVKQQIGDYLAALEQKIEKEFRAKPLEMQKLHLVAYVQDDATQEVLQAATIPVSGDLSVSENPAPAKSATPSAN